MACIYIPTLAIIPTARKAKPKRNELWLDGATLCAFEYLPTIQKARRVLASCEAKQMGVETLVGTWGDRGFLRPDEVKLLLDELRANQADEAREDAAALASVEALSSVAIEEPVETVPDVPPVETVPDVPPVVPRTKRFSGGGRKNGRFRNPE